MKVTIYIETDSKAPKKQKRWCGYVLECVIQGVEKTVDGFIEVEETYHGATVKAIEKALIRIKQPCEVTICAPDGWTLDMFGKNLRTWQRHNFLTAKGEPIANQKEWMHIWLLTEKLGITTKAGAHRYSAWMKREMGIRQNDESQNSA